MNSILVMRQRLEDRCINRGWFHFPLIHFASVINKELALFPCSYIWHIAFVTSKVLDEEYARSFQAKQWYAYSLAVPGVP